jgi:hypothetical protein
MTKLISSGLALSAILALSGCGGGGSSTDTTSNTATSTGTGYYVDSAVSGVSYTCGNQSGTTDENGMFTFEVGNGCSFSIAGVALRTTDSDELVDGKKIIEDNAQVARFLQSIDNDGDPSNGIEIKQEILEVLKAALAEYGSQVPTKESDLEGVVTQVQNKVTNFKGHVKTLDEAKKHLLETETKVLQELLAGQTFYIYAMDEGVQIVAKVVINSDASAWEYEILNSTNASEVGNSGKESIQIEGKKFSATDGSHDDVEMFELKKITDKYLLISDMKFFFSQTDAKAQIKTITSDTLKTILVGKTLYYNNSIAEFKNTGELVWTEGETSEQGTYRIDGDMLYVTDENNEEDQGHKLLSYSDEHISFIDIGDISSSGGYDTTTFYLSAQKAKEHYEAYNYDNTIQESNTTQSTTDTPVANLTNVFVHGVLAWEDTQHTVFSNLSWSEAHNYCDTLNLAGLQWRLPTIDELYTIQDRNNSPEFVSGFEYTDPQSNNYWSSEERDALEAYSIHFATNYTQNYRADYTMKSMPNSVRCVSSSLSSTTESNTTTGTDNSDTLPDVVDNNGCQNPQVTLLQTDNTERTYSDAQEYCASMNGYVPTLDEIKILQDESSESLNLMRVWSSTFVDGESGKHWVAYDTPEHEELIKWNDEDVTFVACVTSTCLD